MPAPETIDYKDVYNDLLAAATAGFPLTAQKASNKL